MNQTVKILKYTARDLFRSRILILYTLFFMLLWAGLFYFTNDATKVSISLIHVVTAVIPLVSLIFGTLVYYNSSDFILFMITQPVERRSVYIAMNTAVSLILSVSLLIGLGLPSLIFGTVSMIPLTLLIIFTSVLVTAVFSNIAFFAGAVSQDKVRALTFVIFIWLFFAVMYDGIILFITVYFYEYPIEIPVLIFSALNPLDLARVILLLHIDHSALMGYTGALYKSVFSGALGMGAAFLLLLVWFTVPFLGGMRVFNRRDF